MEEKGTGWVRGMVSCRKTERVLIEPWVMVGVVKEKSLDEMVRRP